MGKLPHFPLTDPALGTAESLRRPHHWFLVSSTNSIWFYDLRRCEKNMISVSIASSSASLILWSFMKKIWFLSQSRPHQHLRFFFSHRPIAFDFMVSIVVKKNMISVPIASSPASLIFFLSRRPSAFDFMAFVVVKKIWFLSQSCPRRPMAFYLHFPELLHYCLERVDAATFHDF